MIALLSAALVSISAAPPQSVDDALAVVEPFAYRSPKGRREARRVARDLVERSERERELREQVDLLRRSPGAEEKADTLNALSRDLDQMVQDNAAAVESYANAYGWFPQTHWNWDAGWHASIIVQHADHDQDLQMRILATMKPLVDEGQVSLKNYALLFDKVAANLSLPQRYGSQGRCLRAGVWEPLPMEDPANVDTLRNEAGLEPLPQFAEFEAKTCR